MAEYCDYVEEQSGMPLLDRSTTKSAAVMALAFEQGDDCATSAATEGVVRVITDRVGDPGAGDSNFTDKSVLLRVRKKNGEWEAGNILDIKGATELALSVCPLGYEPLGPEDPSAFRYRDVLHVLYTIAIARRDGTGIRIMLGHATGTHLEDLRVDGVPLRDSKEACIGPINPDGSRMVLTESFGYDPSGFSPLGFSVVRASFTTPTLQGAWRDKGVTLHPATIKSVFADYCSPAVPPELQYAWCAEHISPATILSPDIIDPGNGLRAVILNGRSASEDGKFGPFRVGLGLVDPTTGEFPWVDPLPAFVDSASRNITFASEYDRFAGGVAAHRDDSEVRFYPLPPSEIARRLPNPSVVAAHIGRALT